MGGEPRLAVLVRAVGTVQELEPQRAPVRERQGRPDGGPGALGDPAVAAARAVVHARGLRSQWSWPVPWPCAARMSAAVATPVWRPRSMTTGASLPGSSNSIASEAPSRGVTKEIR